MNFRHTLIALGIAAIAAPAFAQSDSSNAMQDSAAQQAASKHPVKAGQKEPLNIQESAPATWSMLDKNNKGYITKTDVKPNTWIAANFTACDKNADSKVTAEEYKACQKPMRQ